jgi:signal transduction histidine kinase
MRFHALWSAVWYWIRAVPVAGKVIGLVMLPVVLVALGGGLFLRQRLQAVLAQHGAGSFQAHILAQLSLQAVVVFLGGTGLGLLAALFLTYLLIDPLRRLMAAMRAVEHGDMRVTVPVWSGDELGRAGLAFNRMVARLRLSRQALLRQHAELDTLNQENARLLAELRSKNERLQQLFQSAIVAREAERKRLARELHDETGQALTSILLRLKALQAETDPEVIADRLNGLRYLTSQTLEDVRRLAVDLRPAALDDLGLVPAIRAYVQAVAEQSQLRIRLEAVETEARLSPEIEIVLYRAVQESLTNVVRHACASQVDVCLAQAPEQVQLTVRDDGRGLSLHATDNGGLGLEGMRERVALAGGSFQARTLATGGTEICLSLPVEKAAVP